MKTPVLIGTMMLVLFQVYSQSNTEVYLFDLNVSDNSFEISNPLNISKSNGYDNQPSFLSNEPRVLFSSTRDGQMDIFSFNYKKNKGQYITSSSGSEFSPTQMPDPAYFSCIILEKSGQQLLWQYPLKGGTPMKVIPDLKVGYHTWIGEDRLYVFVLEEKGNSLYYYTNKQKVLISSQPGRCLQIQPGTNKLTYIEKSSGTSVLLTFDPEKEEKTTLTEAIAESEDFIWIDERKVLMGKDNVLYSYVIGDTDWQKEQDLSEYNLKGITRMAISEMKDKIAIVVNE